MIRILLVLYLVSLVALTPIPNLKDSAGEDAIRARAEKINKECKYGDIMCINKITKGDPSDFEEEEFQKDTEEHSRKKRAAVAGRKNHWPVSDDGFVYIPYFFSTSISNITGAFMLAVEAFNKHTCIRLIPKQAHHKDYINVFHGSGCYVRHLGYQAHGAQDMSLEAYTFCATKGTAIHEIFHVLGFYHEMSRRDRDRYITVHYNNIPSSLASQFRVHPYADGLVFGTEYDKQSIMQYGNWAGSNGGGPAMTSKTNPSETLGNYQDFTVKDLIKVNRMYCPKVAGMVY